MDSDRVLKTGGPLDIWGRAVERQGGNIPEAIAAGVSLQNLAKSVMITCAKLKEEHGKWRLGDVVRNLDSSAHIPVLHFDSGFELGLVDPEFWVKCHIYDPGGYHQPMLFRWSSHTGLALKPLVILRICVQQAARDILGVVGHVELARVRVGRINDEKAYFGLGIDTFDSVSLGNCPVKWEEIYDYALIKNKVRQSIQEWGGIDIGQ